MSGAKRQRPIEIKFRVNEEEAKMIRKKMILSQTRNREAYLRKMAVDGFIIVPDTTYLEKQYYEMHKIGTNINQIAKMANTTGVVNQSDIDEVKGMLKEIWHILRSSPSNLQ